MTSAEILKTSFLDLLFENRNKAYGAYVLRKQYNRRLAAALGISLSAAFLLGILFLQNRNPQANATLNKDLVEDVVVRTQTVPEELKTPAPLPAPKAARPVAQQQYTTIRITTDPVDVTDVPMQEDMTDVAISNTTAAGNPADATPVLTPPATGAGSNPAPQVQVSAPSYTEPQFPGGTAAWTAFLSRHLQAPEALEPGEKKTVLVKFLVSSEGVVTVFEIVQSAGDAFDAEVIRVLKKMPKWKPALQSGQPVAVSFTQPVTFIGMDE